VNKKATVLFLSVSILALLSVLLYAGGPQAEATTISYTSTSTFSTTLLTSTSTTYFSTQVTSSTQSANLTLSTVTTNQIVTSAGSVGMSPTFLTGVAIYGLLMVGLPIALMFIVRGLLGFVAGTIVATFIAIPLQLIAWWAAAANLFMVLVVVMLFKETVFESEG